MTQQQLETKSSEEKEEVKPILRRNHRGCKSEDFYNWPEQPLDDMDSPLAVQQYIQQVIRRNPADIDEILKLPEGQDLCAWKIEHLRLFCMQLNRLATKLQDCCHPETCVQMTATEQWIFLCAAHKQPNECPAIDYTRHTLDGAACMLNSNKYFPSRVTIKESSVAKLASVCRRVYRIFSHAYYHHFQVFDEFEKETHLCKRFSKFVTMYGLMTKDGLIVPSDGSKPDVDTTVTQQNQSPSDATMVSSPATSTVADPINEESSSQVLPETSSSTKSDTGDTQFAKVKSETKNKKPDAEDRATTQAKTNQNPVPTNTNSRLNQTISTNTILKSSISAKGSNLDNNSAKLADGIANADASTGRAGTSTKSSAESEA